MDNPIVIELNSMDSIKFNTEMWIETIKSCKKEITNIKYGVNQLNGKYRVEIYHTN